MQIYEQPTRVLMHEFAKKELNAGLVFDKGLAVKWFKEHYPKIKSGTVQLHVEGMSVNAQSRLSHPGIKPDSGHDLFWKIGAGKYRLWIPETDAPPIYKGKETDKAPEIDDAPDIALDTQAA
ncbi:MAG: DUF7669 domain-containing protein, partial [Caulobacterales bacterium]